MLGLRRVSENSNGLMWAHLGGVIGIEFCGVQSWCLEFVKSFNFKANVEFVP